MSKCEKYIMCGGGGGGRVWGEYIYVTKKETIKRKRVNIYKHGLDIS